MCSAKDHHSDWCLLWWVLVVVVFCVSLVAYTILVGVSVLGRMVDALAAGADEGRGNLR